jgi:hypothetical protein
MFDLFFVCPEQVVNTPCHPRCLIRGISYPLKEEIEPHGPACACSRCIEPIVVKLSMALKEETEIEDGLTQYLLGTKHEGNEKPADSAIPVKKRMDRLELGMDEASPHEQGKLWGIDLSL